MTDQDLFILIVAVAFLIGFVGRPLVDTFLSTVREELAKASKEAREKALLHEIDHRVMFLESRFGSFNNELQKATRSLEEIVEAVRAGQVTPDEGRKWEGVK